MWMMGCGNNNEMNNTSQHLDSFSTLKRLMPKPTPTFPSPKNPPSTMLFNHHDQLLSFNHHHLGCERYNKKEVESQQQQQLYASAKTRWNPTAAQLEALENIYRRGTRTPSSEQIQHIANQLRQYGEIEGKNVFYWFQNHKARERQKRRRVSESSPNKTTTCVVMEEQQADADHDIPDSEVRRTCFEVGQTNNNWSLPNSSFTTHSEEPVLMMHRAVVVVKSKSADGWIELGDRESPQRRKHVREKFTMEEKNKATRRKKLTTTTNYHEDYENINADKSQTLELFPLRSDDELNYVRESHNLGITNFTTPIQFFEFL